MYRLKTVFLISIPATGAFAADLLLSSCFNNVRQRTLFVMQSPEVVVRAKADLEILEKARDGCVDTGLRRLIETWIEEAKAQLAEQTKKDFD